MIPLRDCVNRGVYWVNARNFYLAVFNGKIDADNRFIGMRSKFDHTYLFGELHYESDPHYGTCKPLQLLEMLPDGIETITDVPSTYKDDKGVEHPSFKTYKPLFEYLAELKTRHPWRSPEE